MHHSAKSCVLILRRCLDSDSECLQAIDALKELFTTVLLPSRRLLFFEQHPLAALPAGNEGRHRLMYYYMEDAIKKRWACHTSTLAPLNASRVKEV